jgi:hypothetical protein
MKKTIKYVAPWLLAGVISGTVALAPIASAAPADPPSVTSGQTGEDPLVPYGPDPQVPYELGFYNPNTVDGSGTVNPAGGVDLPG